MTTINQLKKKIAKLLSEQDPIYAAAYQTEALKFCNCILYYQKHNSNEDNEFAEDIRKAILQDVERAMGKRMAQSIAGRDFGVDENIDDIRPPYLGKRGPA